jgi:hypothetical protein
MLFRFTFAFSVTRSRLRGHADSTFHSSQGSSWRAAVNKTLDASPHEDQEESITILKRLSTILESHPNTNIVNLWLPRKAPPAGFKQAKQLAMEAIRTANTTEIIEPQTIRNQKETTKNAAIAAWAERWHQSPHTSKAYQTALMLPPDGKPHIYRFITGHAFTGEYTQRFFPQHTPEQIACQCGEPLQTVEHVLFQCPQFTAAPQTPNSQRPPSKLSTAARKPEARSNAALVPRGDKGLQ